MATDNNIYHLKIHILGISPKVYRRFKVSGDTNIKQLHHLLQIIMGWEDYHLNRLLIFGREYGVAHDGGLLFWDDPLDVNLNGLGLKTGDKFLYEYDLGTPWLHEIRVEKVGHAPKDFTHPVITDAKRACPPEECGGAATYESRLAAQSEWLSDTLRYIKNCVAKKELPDLDLDFVPHWYTTHLPEAYYKKNINAFLAKLYQKNGGQKFWEDLYEYEAELHGLHHPEPVSTKPNGLFDTCVT